MKEIGTLGEKLIARWLQLQNYDLIQRNWHCRWGEIDLIAQDKLTRAIAFVEVKTRSKNNWDENGLLAVTYSKQQKLLKTASLFLAKHPRLAELPCRFDVAIVGYQTFPEQIAHSTLNLEKITQLNIGEAVTIGNRQLFIENYIQSAFE